MISLLVSRLLLNRNRQRNKPQASAVPQAPGRGYGHLPTSPPITHRSRACPCKGAVRPRTLTHSLLQWLLQEAHGEHTPPGCKGQGWGGDRAGRSGEVGITEPATHRGARTVNTPNANSTTSNTARDMQRPLRGRALSPPSPQPPDR